MAWTIPKTFLPEDGLTSSEMNTYVRDNLLETAPGIADGANQLLVASGLNSLDSHKPVKDHVNGAVTTSSTSPTTLDGGTPSVTFDHTGSFLVLFASRLRNTGSTSNSWAINFGPEVPGETPAELIRAVRWPGSGFARMAGHALYYGIAPGTTEVRANYWVSDSSQTGEYAQRQILVIPM